LYVDNPNLRQAVWVAELSTGWEHCNEWNVFFLLQFVLVY